MKPEGWKAAVIKTEIDWNKTKGIGKKKSKNLIKDD